MPPLEIQFAEAPKLPHPESVVEPNQEPMSPTAVEKTITPKVIDKPQSQPVPVTEKQVKPTIKPIKQVEKTKPVQPIKQQSLELYIIDLLQKHQIIIILLHYLAVLCKLSTN